MWMAYDHLNENDENETVFCRGEDLDNTLKPYEIADKLNQLEEIVDGLKLENTVLIKRLWDYEYRASGERIRDEK